MRPSYFFMDAIKFQKIRKGLFGLLEPSEGMEGVVPIMAEIRKNFYNIISEFPGGNPFTPSETAGVSLPD